VPRDVGRPGVNMANIKSSYLENNPDFRKFLDASSDDTGRKCMDDWMKNLRDNRELFRRTGWASEKLQGIEQGKTAVIMGSSPALQKQVEDLRNLMEDDRFVLCGTSSNLEFLLNNGIKPKYVITVDGDKSQGEFFDTIDMNKTKDITLIANCFAYAPMLPKWKGPLYFLALQTDDKKFRKKHEKFYGALNGVGAGFPSIMSSFSIMAAASHLMLECNVIIFVGNELSYKDDDSKYYVDDREDFRDNYKRYPHGDIYGNIVNSNFLLLAVKYSLEGFLELLQGTCWFFNCTEAGIFGITKRFPDQRVPWIEQLTLENGIAQARQIMRTGQPFYE
jgi:hypothetical protein